MAKDSLGGQGWLCQGMELSEVVVVGTWLGQTPHPWLCTSHCQCVNGVEREQFCSATLAWGTAAALTSHRQLLPAPACWRGNPEPWGVMARVAWPQKPLQSWWGPGWLFPGPWEPCEPCAVEARHRRCSLSIPPGLEAQQLLQGEGARAEGDH